MKTNCLKHLEKAHALAEQLLVVADQGDAEREDVGCGIVFGTVRDYGYKLRAMIEKEINNHKDDASEETRPKDI